MATLELIKLVKRYEDVVSVRGIDFSAGASEFVCLLGPSGCGKTTTLRMIAGLVNPDEGEIRVDGRSYALPVPLILLVALGAVLVVVLATAVAARGILASMSPSLLRTASDDVD